CVMHQYPADPGQISNARHDVKRENESRAGNGGALGEQVPGGVDEGGEDDECKREQRHETSGPSGTFVPSGKRTRSRHRLLWAFVPRVQPRTTAVSATLGPATACGRPEP